jgi:hypothetical protein
MTSTSPPQGWYPDPNQPGLLRWWDGQAWTAQTQPAGALPPPPTAPDTPSSQRVGDFTIPTNLPPSGPGRGGWGGRTGTGGPMVGRGNRLSITVFCVEAVYLVLAATTGFFLIGILPLILSIRAISAKEKLAPLALAFTIVGFVLSLFLAGHHHSG